MNYYAKKLRNTVKPLLGLSFTNLNYDIQKKKRKRKKIFAVFGDLREQEKNRLSFTPKCCKKLSMDISSKKHLTGEIQ